jgi:hypothetical protein
MEAAGSVGHYRVAISKLGLTTRTLAISLQWIIGRANAIQESLAQSGNSSKGHTLENSSELRSAASVSNSGFRVKVGRRSGV